jgi:hypothetical protein
MLLYLFPGMELSFVHPGAGGCKAVPVLLGFQIRSPEREAPALQRSCIIHSTASVPPEYTVEVLLLYQAYTESSPYVHFNTIFFKKFILSQGKFCGKLFQIFMGEEDITRIKPAAAGAALAFEMETIFVKRLFHKTALRKKMPPEKSGGNGENRIRTYED